MNENDINPINLEDWEIAELAESKMQKIEDIIDKIDIKDDEWILKGDGIAKLKAQTLWNRVKDNEIGKYIDVTAIIPTPLGEGKQQQLLDSSKALQNLVRNQWVRFVNQAVDLLSI